MQPGMRMRRAAAALLTLTMLGGLTATGPIAARADDAKDKSAPKSKDKKPSNIPIKIVDPIIVPDKGKAKSSK